MAEIKNTPKHVAIILDGNRRFAKRLMMEPWKGHEYGKNKMEHLMDWCKELGIKELTLYAFSMQNFNRPKEEFDYLMKLFKEGFDVLLNSKKIEKDGVKIRVIGRYHLFPKDLVEKMEKVIEKTKNNTNYIANFAMAYGGREEIVDAVKKIAEEVKNGKIKPEDINEEIIKSHLYLQSEPDLIIRTAGEKRTSNFLMWQSYYSEWAFIDKTWPEFEKQDLINILEEFSQRDRRFGK